MNTTALTLDVGAGTQNFTGAIAVWRHRALRYGSRQIIKQVRDSSGGIRTEIKQLGAAPRFNLGCGIRLTSLYFFTDTQVENSNSVGERAIIQHPQLLASNISFSIRFRISKLAIRRKWSPFVGANIDLAGVTFGAKRIAQLASSTGPNSAQPAFFNLLRGNRRDRGTLNSRLYADILVTNRLTCRTGINHLIASYSISQDNYQKFFSQAFLGIGYGLGSSWRYY